MDDYSRQTHKSTNTGIVAHLHTDTSTVKTNTWIHFSLLSFICFNLRHVHKTNQKPSAVHTFRIKNSSQCKWINEVTNKPQFIKVKLSCGIWDHGANVVVCCEFSFQTDRIDVPRMQTPWCHQMPSCSLGAEGRKPGPCWIHDAGLTSRCCAPWEQQNSQAASTPWSAGSLGFACSNPERREMKNARLRW